MTLYRSQNQTTIHSFPSPRPLAKPHHSFPPNFHHLTPSHPRTTRRPLHESKASTINGNVRLCPRTIRPVEHEQLTRTLQRRATPVEGQESNLRLNERHAVFVLVEVEIECVGVGACVGGREEDF